jgi:hypothetical protein
MPQNDLEVKQETLADCHFTYCHPKGKDLLQGDVIGKNAEIEEILKKEHPLYFGETVSHFIILTQSCDLVRRDDKPCNAKYITLAVVRPLRWVLGRELEKYQDEFDKAARVCKDEVKFKMKQFLERLMNNNEPEYFYLHEDTTLGYQESSCALLRFAFTLNTKKYYDSCFQARIMSLKDIFQARLGWLVGNIYSRVGTEEWTDHLTVEEFTGKIQKHLEELSLWVDSKQLKEAKRTAPKDLLKSNPEIIREHITKTEVPRRREKILDCVTEAVQKLTKVRQKDVTRFRKQLDNNPEFSKWVR